MPKLSSCSSCEGFLPTGARVCPHCDARIAGPGLSITKIYRGLMATTVGSALSVTLMACYGVGTGLDCTDNDGDGYCAEIDDCNDNNELIHPGSEDLAGDGVDHDCDGCDEPAPVEALDDAGNPIDEGDAGVIDGECTVIEEGGDDAGTGDSDAGPVAQ